MFSTIGEHDATVASSDGEAPRKKFKPVSEMAKKRLERLLEETWKPTDGENVKTFLREELISSTQFLGSGTFGQVVAFRSDLRCNRATKIFGSHMSLVKELRIRQLVGIDKHSSFIVPDFPDPSEANLPVPRILQMRRAIPYRDMSVYALNFPNAMDEHHIEHYVMDILDGLVFLHAQNVAHTDIKPENIVFEPSRDNPTFPSARIIDMGGALHCTHATAVYDAEKDSYCAFHLLPFAAHGVTTWSYRPPEYFPTPEVIVSEGDLWSLGATVCRWLDPKDTHLRKALNGIVPIDTTPVPFKQLMAVACYQPMSAGRLLALLHTSPRLHAFLLSTMKHSPRARGSAAMHLERMRRSNCRANCTPRMAFCDILHRHKGEGMSQPLPIQAPSMESVNKGAENFHTVLQLASDSGLKYAIAFLKEICAMDWEASRTHNIILEIGVRICLLCDSTKWDALSIMLAADALWVENTSETALQILHDIPQRHVHQLVPIRPYFNCAWPVPMCKMLAYVKPLIKAEIHRRQKKYGKKKTQKKEEL